jgi:hypothetical protein
MKMNSRINPILICAALLLAISLSTSAVAGNLLANPGFENGSLADYQLVLDNFAPGLWGAETADIVTGAEHNVTPAGGSKMLRVNYNSGDYSQVFQVTNVSSPTYQSLITSPGGVKAGLSALFDVDPNGTSAVGGVSLHFYSGTDWGSDNILTVGRGATVNTSPGWQTISISDSLVDVPSNTKYLVSEVWYRDDASLASYPGYADSATLTMTPEPSTMVLLLGGLAGLLFYAWRRRR